MTLATSRLNPELAAIERILNSRRQLVGSYEPYRYMRKAEAEGGCGVIGIACSVPIEGRHLLQSLIQMRNRGNGKGGGAALAGLVPSEFGVDQATLGEDYMVAVAYLDPSARSEVERDHLIPVFEIDSVHEMHPRADRALGTPAPDVTIYFVRPRQDALDAFTRDHSLEGAPAETAADELVYQNSCRLNSAYYASLGDKRAFVLSHGKDLLVLKLVGYGEDVFHAYGLAGVNAHVWIGHHRYPTKGRVWHPGGAHPFVGLHEALVHNGDFANYASVCAYLAQHGIHPLFLTDTEVSVLVFDLLHRTFGYPLEYVIEAMAPTTERDFAMLPETKQSIYQMLQATHIHGSPDGPWFFLLAQSVLNGDGRREARLIGITDTSMLRPQVFALQQGEPGQPSIGLAASEKQAIDAALDSLSRADPRFWGRPDRYWNARGGSHTDGGAFVFTVRRHADGTAELHCRDKFGRLIEIDETALPDRRERRSPHTRNKRPGLEGTAHQVYSRIVAELGRASYGDLEAMLDRLLSNLNSNDKRAMALEVLTRLMDERYPTGNLRRSSVLAQYDAALSAWVSAVRHAPTPGFAFHGDGMPLPVAEGSNRVVIDASGMAVEGHGSLASCLIDLVRNGFRRLIVVDTRGHRFIANGLGADTSGVRLDVYGSPGDYLGSGIDGATIRVHGSGQDQLAQIMKAGRLIVFGDVGQTFMYGAKGGEAFVMGNAAGRPLINAVGKPKVVINGSCLDYLAESFMAGDPFNGGGFVILNGMAFSDTGKLVELDTPYPGGNLFSLASGGAIFVRDPQRTIGEDQLNGGRFSTFEERHWGLIRPMLEENERLFGIPVQRLLRSGGARLSPDRVYRLIVPARHQALQPEQAWVSH